MSKTDPVREEMMHKAEVLAAPNDPSWKPRAKLLITDLLRVIKGHCSQITIASGPGMVIKALVCNDELAQTLGSLPEEVKSGKGEQL